MEIDSMDCLPIHSIPADVPPGVVVKTADSYEVKVSMIQYHGNKSFSLLNIRMIACDTSSISAEKLTWKATHKAERRVIIVQELADLQNSSFIQML